MKISLITPLNGFGKYFLLRTLAKLVDLSCLEYFSNMEEKKGK